MYNRSAICKAANNLIKQGYSRSEAFRQAWRLAKQMTSKVSGVSFGQRQKALQRLSHYQPEMVSVDLIREQNRYDDNAVAVYAEVQGKGSYRMGYVPKETAGMIASLIDAGNSIKASFQSVVGGWFEGQSYGMRIELAI